MPLNLTLWAFRCQGMSLHHCGFPPRRNSHYLPTLSGCIFQAATSSSINQTAAHWAIIPLCFIWCKERNHLTERVQTWMTSPLWRIPSRRLTASHWTLPFAAFCSSQARSKLPPPFSHWVCLLPPHQVLAFPSVVRRFGPTAPLWSEKRK